MRNLLLITIAAVLIISCGGSKKQIAEDAFVIKGQLENSAGLKIYLDHSGQGGTIDSTEFDGAGNFTLTGVTKTPNIYVLYTNRKNFTFLLIDDKEQVILSGNALALDSELAVEGSKGTTLLFEVKNRTIALSKEIEGLKEQVGEAQKRGENILPKVQAEANNLVKAHQDYLKDFITKNPKSLATIAALYQKIGDQSILSPEADKDYFKKVDDALMASYPNNFYVKDFHTKYLQTTRQTKREEVNQAAIGIGSLAPEISYPNPQGQIMSLSELKGKYVLLDFWAAWCGPCRRESPHLVESYAKYNKQGFEIFQVSLDKKKQAWVDAIAKDNLHWPYHVSDLQYWNSVPAKLYNVSSIPTNYLLDPEGKVIAKNLRGHKLSTKLEEIFGK